jgi:hypothetical protein
VIEGADVTTDIFTAANVNVVTTTAHTATCYGLLRHLRRKRR